ncbi:hypothetical protein D3C81_2125580 [compost metagenome]
MVCAASITGMFSGHIAVTHQRSAALAMEMISSQLASQRRKKRAMKKNTATSKITPTVHIRPSSDVL